MDEPTQATNEGEGADAADISGWIERSLDASGLVHLARSLKLAASPPMIGIALLTVLATLAFGSLLDAVWSAGGHAVSTGSIPWLAQQRDVGGAGGHTLRSEAASLSPRQVKALSEFPESGFEDIRAQIARPGTPPDKINALLEDMQRQRTGIYQHFCTYERNGLRRADVTGMIVGFHWLVTRYPLFALVFGLGSWIIWSFGGGAMCRIAALRFTGAGEVSFRDGFLFARENFGQLLFAPALWFTLALLGCLLLLVMSLPLHIPWIGDLLGIIICPLGMLGGVVIAVLLIVGLAAFPLAWPAAAAEGIDATDAASRSAAYLSQCWWKAAWYGVVASVLAAVGYLVLNIVLGFGLGIARTMLGWFNTTFLGLGGRIDDEKIHAIWPAQSPFTLPHWPHGEALGLFSYDYISAFVIFVCLSLIAIALWSMVSSFYFSASTIAYLLLRRDVDGEPLHAIHAETAAKNTGGDGRPDADEADS